MFDICYYIIYYTTYTLQLLFVVDILFIVSVVLLTSLVQRIKKYIRWLPISLDVILVIEDL